MTADKANTLTVTVQEITMRDYFAGQVLGSIAGSKCVIMGIPATMDTGKAMAQMSYELADAMIAAREVQP